MLKGSESLLAQTRAREEADSPGKDRKSFKGENDASIFLTEMRAMFAKEREASDKQHGVLVEDMPDMNDQMKQLSGSIDEERRARAADIKKVNMRFEEQAKTKRIRKRGGRESHGRKFQRRS